MTEQPSNAPDAPEVQQSLNEQMLVRREKRERLLAEGKKAYAIEVGRTHTLAEGIAVGQPGRITRELIGRLVDDLVLVDEGETQGLVIMFRRWAPSTDPLEEPAERVIEGQGRALADERAVGRPLA